MNDRLAAFGLLSFMLPLAGGAAHAETTYSADVGVEGSYGSNPYLSTEGGGSATATGVARFSPVINFIGPRTQSKLSGTVSHTVYSRLYPDQTDYMLNGSVSSRISSRSSVNLNGGYSRRTNNYQTLLGTVVDENGNVISDPAAYENAGRKQESITAGAGFSTTLSSRDTFSVQGTIGRFNFPGNTSYASHYTTYGGSAGLSHSLNSRVSLSANASYTKQVYGSNPTGVSFGDSNQIYPSLTVGIKLAPRWTLTLNGGASFSSIQQGTGTINRTSFSGSISLCKRGDRSNLCISGRRGVVPSNILGISTTNSASGSYSYQLTPRSSFSVNLDYQDTSSFTPGVSTGYGYFAATGGYQHQIAQRLSLNLSARYSDPIKSVTARRDSVYGSVGLSYRLGRN